MNLVGSAKIHEFDTLFSIHDDKISSQDMASLYGYGQSNRWEIGLPLGNHWRLGFVAEAWTK
jgi:hypothetical protein